MQYLDVEAPVIENESFHSFDFSIDSPQQVNPIKTFEEAKAHLDDLQEYIYNNKNNKNGDDLVPTTLS